ncbi:MAG: HEAT repeat domain-containing protein, partial [Myxococcota bacterium]|nr:HEAT repeat domain-containing protein [Myxococcota bacterium]
AAAQALGTLADGRARDDLAFALADEDERVRLAAVESLARFPDASVAPVLLEGLGAASAPVQAAMARALARLGAHDAVGPLRALLESAAPVAAAAIEALGALGSSELADDVSRALAHADPEVAHAAVSVSARLPVDVARPLRQRALAHPAWHVRRAAVRALADDSVARASLRAAVGSDEDPMVREALLEAIGDDPEQTR